MEKDYTAFAGEKKSLHFHLLFKAQKLHEMSD